MGSRRVRTAARVSGSATALAMPDRVDAPLPLCGLQNKVQVDGGVAQGAVAELRVVSTAAKRGSELHSGFASNTGCSGEGNMSVIGSTVSSSLGVVEGELSALAVSEAATLVELGVESQVAEVEECVADGGVVVVSVAGDGVISNTCVDSALPDTTFVVGSTMLTGADVSFAPSEVSKSVVGAKIKKRGQAWVRLLISGGACVACEVRRCNSVAWYAFLVTLIGQIIGLGIAYTSTVAQVRMWGTASLYVGGFMLCVGGICTWLKHYKPLLFRMYSRYAFLEYTTLILPTLCMFPISTYLADFSLGVEFWACLRGIVGVACGTLLAAYIDMLASRLKNGHLVSLTLQGVFAILLLIRVSLRLIAEMRGIDFYMLFLLCYAFGSFSMTNVYDDSNSAREFTIWVLIVPCIFTWLSIWCINGA